MTATEHPTVRCADCRTDWASTTRFCGRCGQRLAIDTPPARGRRLTVSNRPARLLGVGALSLLLAATIVVVNDPTRSRDAPDTPVSLVSPGGRFVPPPLATSCTDTRGGCATWARALGGTDGPVADAFTRGGRVYLLVGDEVVAADADGERWRLRHGLDADRIRPSGPDELAILGTDTDGERIAIVVDLRTGTRTWRAEATDVDATIPGMLVEGEPGLPGVTLRRIDPVSGAPRWKLDLVAGRYSIAGDLLVVEEDDASAAHDLETGEALWRAEATRPLHGPPRPGGPVTVVAAETIRGLDRTTGEPVWEVPFVSGRSRTATALPGLILLEHRRADPRPTLELTALDPASGATRWRAEVPGVEAPLYRTAEAGRDGLVLAVNVPFRSRIVWIDARTGAIRWSVAAEDPWPTIATADGGIAVIGERGAAVLAASDGEAVTRLSTGPETVTFPMDGGPAEILVVDGPVLRWFDLPGP